MTAIYSSMLEAGLPEHLMLHVAKKVHTVLMKESLTKIGSLLSPFEKIFMENEDVLEALKKEFPEMEIRVQNDWLCGEHITVVLKLTKERFILWHEYKEYRIDEVFLMEGFYKGDESYVMERFIWIDCWNELKMNRVEEYRQQKCRNHIPFNFLHWAMNGAHRMVDVRFQDSGEKWFNPDKILSWFFKKEAMWVLHDPSHDDI